MTENKKQTSTSAEASWLCTLHFVVKVAMDQFSLVVQFSLVDFITLPGMCGVADTRNRLNKLTECKITRFGKRSNETYCCKVYC